MVRTGFVDAMSYITSVKDAFLAQPEIYGEFLRLLNEYRANTMTLANVVERMEEIFKDHKELYFGFMIFLPTGMNIPARYASSYNRTVKEAFRAQPAKYDEFEKLTRDYMSHKIDVDTFVAKVEEVMKYHQNLLLDFIYFLPSAQRTISPESEQRAANFMAKLRVYNAKMTRFQGNDLRVVESFHEILRKFKEGKKTAKEVHEEVVKLLEGHDDLVMELTDFFSGRLLEIAKYITRLLQL